MNDKPIATSLILSLPQTPSTSMSSYSYVLDNSNPCPLIYILPLPHPQKCPSAFSGLKLHFCLTSFLANPNSDLWPRIRKCKNAHIMPLLKTCQRLPTALEVNTSSDGIRRKNRERVVKARQSWILVKIVSCHGAKLKFFSHSHYTFNVNTDQIHNLLKIIPTSIPFKLQTQRKYLSLDPNKSTL